MIDLYPVPAIRENAKMISQPDADKSKPDKPKLVEVHVQSLKTNAKVNLKLPEATTIEALWDAAIGTDELNEPRTAGDTIRCKDGTDLMGHLSDTLAILGEAKICQQRHFEVRGPSGGASD